MSFSDISLISTGSSIEPKSVEIEINSHVIDRHYGEWLNIWAELTGSTCQDYNAFNKMIGDTPELTNFSKTKN